MVAKLERCQVRMDGRTIERVARAIAKWAVPANDWDYYDATIQERWRSAARIAVAAMKAESNQ